VVSEKKRSGVPGGWGERRTCARGVLEEAKRSMVGVRMCVREGEVCWGRVVGSGEREERRGEKKEGEQKE
jgi:hypothetical protein